MISSTLLIPNFTSATTLQTNTFHNNTGGLRSVLFCFISIGNYAKVNVSVSPDMAQIDPMTDIQRLATFTSVKSEYFEKNYYICQINQCNLHTKASFI